MIPATIILGAKSWITGVVLLALAGAALISWSYRGKPGSLQFRALCAGLKIAALTLLLLCLLEPLWSSQQAKPGANHFAILADNSQSLGIHDPKNPLSRGQVMTNLLTGKGANWQDSIEKAFSLRRFTFDERLQAAPDFQNLNFDGRSSSLISALKEVGTRFKGQPLAGALIFTDGNATDLSGDDPALPQLPPLYFVAVGGNVPIRDLSLGRVSADQTAFEDAPVTVVAEVSAVGFSGRRVVAELREVDKPAKSATNKLAAVTKPLTNAPVVVLATETQRVNSEKETLSFRFNVRPTKPGVNLLEVKIRDADNTPVTTGESGEATLANNARIVAVDRGRGPYSVLYISGRPNWEFKFLNRAVNEDDQVRLVGMIRVAKREPKFSFRGRQGETSNPLFRGFGNQSAEEIERYDQPVLVRLNTRDKDELKTGFPKTPEDLYPYHAIIIDDLEAEFFTPEQMSLLQKYVSERGGSVLMLGGAESFSQGKYQRTPIGDMLPVYLDHPDTTTNAPLQVKFNLTREGMLQPWVRLRNNEGEEKARVDEMPPFLTINMLHEIKPGASVLAKAVDPAGKEYPALVVQRFGRGRTGALMLGDLWHWGLRDKDQHKDLDKAWRQIVRWLVADVPERVELQAQPIPGDPNNSITLQTRARDKKFLPQDGANVTITVRFVPSGSTNTLANSTNTIKLTAEPSTTEPGLYEAVYVPRNTGGYVASVTATDGSGAPVGTSEAGWTSDPAADEFRSLQPNRALLETLARRTGGAVIEAADLNSFAKKLPNLKAPVMEVATKPLWDTPAVLGLALICFASEWGLRRWKGLA